jgi:hypothetical protein
MVISWMNYSYQAAMMGWDCHRVIGMRLARISAGGPTAGSEAMLMVNEKVAAVVLAGITLASGGSHDKVLRNYRRVVKANIRRLSGGQGS